MRVAEFLTQRQVPFETLLHPPCYTAQQRAKSLGITGRQVAKAVLLHGPTGYFVAILPAPRHIDLTRLAAALGGPVRLAGDQEIAEVFRDCEWGVVPPFGALYGLPAVLDSLFEADSQLVFEGQFHGQALRLRCRDYERLEKPRRLSFSCP